MKQKDEQHMREALRLAAAAASRGEVPVGAVLVLDGRVIGSGQNSREQSQSVLGHAELAAIREAARRLGSWRLTGATLYVTLEPCLMCAGAIIQSRIARLVYGAADPKAGMAGSVRNAFEFPGNHQVQVCRGVLAAESRDLLQDFFKKRRRLNRLRGTSGARRKIGRTNPRSPRRRAWRLYRNWPCDKVIFMKQVRAASADTTCTDSNPVGGAPCQT